MVVCTCNIGAGKRTSQAERNDGSITRTFQFGVESVKIGPSNEAYSERMIVLYPKAFEELGIYP